MSDGWIALRKNGRVWARLHPQTLLLKLWDRGEEVTFDLREYVSDRRLTTDGETCYSGTTEVRNNTPIV